MSELLDLLEEQYACGDSSYICIDQDFAIKEATDAGFDIITDGILIDYDSPDFYGWLTQTRDIRKEFGLTIIDAWRSKHGNCHIQIGSYDIVDTYERLLLQLILGSDPLKEAASFRRLRAGSIEYYSLLFRPSNATRLAFGDGT
jgi:hypothetical protein